MADPGSGQQMTIQQALELGTSAHLAGQKQRAETIYRQILAADPAHPDALHQLGLLAIDAGNLPLAEQLISRAISSRADEPNYHSNLGFVRNSLHRYIEAAESCRRALQLAPNFADAMINLGNALSCIGQADEAVALIRRAILLRPDAAGAWNDLGTALQKADRWGEAIDAFQRAIQLNPSGAWTHLNLGTALLHERRTEEALAAYLRAVEIDPTSAVFISHAGTAFQALGKLAEAEQAYRKAIALDPKLGSAHFNLGMLQLLRGDFTNGWREYEWRIRAYEELDLIPQRFAQPAWEGADPRGKRILLHAEQGLGDTIHFARYATLLADRGAAVIVQCRAELVRLLRSLAGVSHVVSKTDPLPEFDLHCPLPSLPLRFETQLGTIPSIVPYLHAEPAAVERWKTRLTAHQADLKVGLAWAGSPKHLNDRNRSMALEDFSPLVMPGVMLVSLQKQTGTKPHAVPLVDYTDDLTDLAETAGLIANLDMVITVDTSIAHLVGALGKPVWVMLPFAPDWRWMLDRADSPWYPTMKFFRQRIAGDWKPVADQVAGELKNLLGQRKS